MSGIQNLSRRDFLKNTGITGAMVLGAQMAPSSLIAAAQAQSTGASVQPNLFVSIADDGMVTITCSRSEMGQGVRTGIPMILADELEADWQRVKIWQAPGDAEKYDPAGKDGQNTDGSRSTRHHLDIMRELGAAGRVRARAGGGRASGASTRARCTRRTTGFTMMPRADPSTSARWWMRPADIAVPTGADAPKLKDPSQWKYIGRDMPVVDNFDMSTGRGRLRGRHHHARDEDRGHRARAGVPREGEVLRRGRGAQGTGRRPGGRAPGPPGRQAGRVPGPRGSRGHRHEHLVGARRPPQARHRVGRRTEHRARFEHLQRRALRRGPRRRTRHPRPRKRRRGVRSRRPGARGGVLRALLHPHPDGAAGRDRRRQREAGADRHVDPVARTRPGSTSPKRSGSTSRRSSVR